MSTRHRWAWLPGLKGGRTSTDNIIMYMGYGGTDNNARVGMADLVNYNANKKNEHSSCAIYKY